MKKFIQVNIQPKTQTPIAQMCIDTTEVTAMNVGVYHNPNKFTAQLQIDFAKPQKGWGTDRVTLVNDLYKINNIAYKMPADFDFAKEWYDAVILKSREFTKYTGSNLHTKMGYRFNSNYHTIPYTWMSYDPNTNLCKVYLTIPDKTGDDFTNHVEVECTLDKVGEKNLHFCWLKEDAN